MHGALNVGDTAPHRSEYFSRIDLPQNSAHLHTCQSFHPPKRCILQEQSTMTVLYGYLPLSPVQLPLLAGISINIR
jgi:hypothetical protein